MNARLSVSPVLRFGMLCHFVAFVVGTLLDCCVGVKWCVGLPKDQKEHCVGKAK